MTVQVSQLTEPEARLKVVKFLEWCRLPEGEAVRRVLEDWDDQGGVLTILCDMVRSSGDMNENVYPWNYLTGEFSLNSLLTKCCQFLCKSSSLPEGWSKEFCQERVRAF